MKSILILPLLLVGLSASVLAGKQEKINTDLVNSNVERTIDLVSQLVKISSIISLRNDGSSAVKSFLLAVDAKRAQHLSYLGAGLKSDDDKKDLKVTRTEVPGNSDGTFYKVELSKSLGAGDTVDVTVDTIFTKDLRPYPAEIPQSEKQYMEFKGNVYFYSPYKTESQTTEVKLASSTIEFYSKINPVTQSDSTISYGPYDNVGPFSEEKIRIHYENNNPFLVVTSMTRVIEVSHWGNIAVEETYDIYHSGAKLKGSFSRYDYQRMQDGYSSIKSFKTILPASAKDVYYRDEIGNISTSNLLEHEDHVELELRPRFPLFGGWKTHYVIGYNLPSYENLYNAGDKYILLMRLLDHVFDDMVVDELTVKVILPEGCKDIDLKTSFDIERKSDELHFTYLDTIGRPVIVARKTNLVEQHIADFELHYSFNKILLLQEPLLVVGAFFILFFTVIILVRLDFSIAKDEASESRMRIASLVESVVEVIEKKRTLYGSYDDAITKFKSTKDSTGFQATLKKLDAEGRAMDKSIQSTVASLKQEGSDIAEKVGELQKLGSLLKEFAHTAVTNAEKVVANKQSKQQYLDLEKALTAKRNDVKSKMDAILATLY
ncbi:dolichyl-diphosphooligosaccharide--protein glycosyltransferase subunit 1-like [Acanthaster planci]|uniref:Dolichyl-diphosphooligosaccharide--protein glycosyltransferase subunit 1 n=1 Tax=Acanthaster planci TaxID=133434 RepID=A0A8B7Z2P6_ACAPL|nr:dolichyl-diphosphooligosaccharide--protein glycosyltransferase subunit 1-like [Acanthaster planci]